jgi:prepilin-type N-terminal cleavage/methylation domain-containing protein
MRGSNLRRGFTLIELMVSIAILSIVILAATSVVVAVARQRRESTNQLEVRTNGRIGLAMMQFDAANAGFRFGSPPFAVRVLQNVTSAHPELADATDCGGRPGWAVLPGTDVIEFREGLDGRAVGRTTATSNIFNGGSAPNPWVNNFDGLNQVVFFSSPVKACAARLTSTVDVGNFTLIDQSLRNNAPPTAYPTGGPEQCPAPDMAITALGRVTRYLVCGPPAFQPNLRPALFRQRWGPTYPLAGSLIDFVSVQEGIEDLQVATQLSLATNPGMVSGATCEGAGLQATCWCGLVTGDCAQYVPDPTGTGGTLDGTSTVPARRSAFLARAYRVSLTTIAQRARGFSDQAIFTRPAVFDHAAGVVDQYSNNHRAVVETIFTPQNINMVAP